MPRIIVGLDHTGHQLRNEVIKYCQVTGNPSRPENVTAIYQECLGQIFGKIDADFQRFMINLMEVPDWRMIHFIDTPIDYTHLEPFRNAVRAFGIMIWNRLKERGNLDQQCLYLLESCTESYAIVGAYVDSANT